MTIKVFDKSRLEVVTKIKGEATLATSSEVNAFMEKRATASSNIGTATSALRVEQAKKSISLARKALTGAKKAKTVKETK